MHISQACSLRRHHMSMLNPRLSKPALRLGTNDQIVGSAQLFEQAIANFLRRHSVEFLDEQQQRDKEAEDTCRLTPDFKLETPLSLRVCANGQVLSERTIHWIEAKMFYGASTIPPDSKSAVGCVLPKMKKYVASFGPGCVVFMQGCGEGLATELDEIGVTALSCLGTSVNLKAVHAHQKTWCADKNGNILP